MKTIGVGFANQEVKKAFDALKEGKFEDKHLYEFILRAVDDLKKNPYIGINIPKNLIPVEYAKKFGTNNLRKYNLPNAWRLIYTLKGNEIEIVSVILEWMDHKEYERHFKY
ncbi:MAG: hypothetical protein HY831_04200 [Candidatus Aenigmarchaeota archaeon]|nr:hypothetical protein [Candidatus Aenigmarchaeota archaeon]